MSIAKGKGKRKNILSGVKRTTKIALGALIAICAFFLAGYAVDFFARRDSQSGSNIRFLPFADRDKPADSLNSPQPEKSSSKSSPSFFETLFQTEHSREQLDSKREKELLKSVKKKRTPKHDYKNKLHDSKTDGKKLNTVSAKLIYKIQLGSFQNSEGAKAFSEKLKKKGYKPYIIKVALSGKGTLYRVRIGKFENIEEAQKKATEIEKKEKISVLITSR